MQKPTFRPRKPSKGFSLMELLIYLALAAVFIGGILTLTGRAGVDSDAKAAVADIMSIHNAMKKMYGAQRIRGADSTQMGNAIRSMIPELRGTSAPDLQNQFNAPIVLEADTAAASTTNFEWPHYWVSYQGLAGPTCAAVLGGLGDRQAAGTGSVIRAHVEANRTAKGTWTIATGTTNADHRGAGASTICDGIGDNEYQVHVLMRI